MGAVEEAVAASGVGWTRLEPQRTTPSARITGRSARTFTEGVTEHADRFRAAEANG
ncbi:hypothetical protein [Streptomyces sp. NPDC005017]|uniref:hypothetical protein n=1 Tax=Streptomyces sp. NPDC005017 TaxID=3364706 RepID=UPI003676C3DD